MPFAIPKDMRESTTAGRKNIKPNATPGFGPKMNALNTKRMSGAPAIIASTIAPTKRTVRLRAPAMVDGATVINSSKFAPVQSDVRQSNRTSALIIPMSVPKAERLMLPTSGFRTTTILEKKSIRNTTKRNETDPASSIGSHSTSSGAVISTEIAPKKQQMPVVKTRDCLRVKCRLRVSVIRSFYRDAIDDAKHYRDHCRRCSRYDFRQTSGNNFKGQEIISF